jgi:S-adenosylmethionine synthetase
MARRTGLLPYLTPDGTTQVGIEYRQRRPYRIHSLTVVASQNAPGHVNGPHARTFTR